MAPFIGFCRRLGEVVYAKSGNLMMAETSGLRAAIIYLEIRVGADIAGTIDSMGQRVEVAALRTLTWGRNTAGNGTLIAMV